MKITEVSVSWSETVSLPGFSNVKTSTAFTARVEESEEAFDIRRQLLNDARTLVRDEIDDVLEANNQRPKYYTGPRFQVMYSGERRCVIIMSDDTNDWPDGFVHKYNTPRGIRLETAQKRAKQMAQEKGYELVYCLDDDFSKLPEKVSKPTLVEKAERDIPF